MKIIIFWKPFIWLALICYGLFVPASEIPMQPFLKIPHFDKLVHFTLFFVLCLLLVKPFKELKWRHFITAPLFSLFLSFTLEISQQTISSTRSSNIYDFIANATGVAAAVLFYAFFVSGKKWEKLF